MDQIISYISNRRSGGILCMVFLSAFFFIGLGDVHLFDWDEINFAESAREMLESGNYSVVQINYTPFWEKPPLFFWMQALSMKIFGINEFASRFPNALFGLIYMITLYILGSRMKDINFGIFWSLLFFGSFLPHLYFKSGIIDPVFNYFIFLSIYFAYRVFENDHNNYKNAIFAGLFSGLSFITKGPVGLLLLILTVSFFIISQVFFPMSTGRFSFQNGIHLIRKHCCQVTVWKELALFILGFTLIVATWLSAEIYYHGFDILVKFVYYQIELFNTPVAGHGQPFYYHFVVVLLGCFPASVLAIPALISGQVRTIPTFRLWMIGLFWVVMTVFSLSTTKIVHYSSMTYLPLTFLAASYVYEVHLNRTALKKYVLYLLGLMGFVWFFVLTSILFLLDRVHLIVPYIRDEFAVQSLLTSVSLTGYESAIGVFFLVGIIVSFYFFVTKRALKALFSASFTIGATLLLMSIFVLPIIEKFTQGPAINFYKSLENKDVYVETAGFKSYAQYFYSKTKPQPNPNRKDMNWLLRGEIDKVVYFVTKVNYTDLDTIKDIKKLKTEGGFSFYKREPREK